MLTGAAKRFKHMFENFDVIVCGKIRDGDTRNVIIQDGDAMVQAAYNYTHCAN